MAELFSKEYLKELLASDSLADAAATTAKAGFESAVKKAADGGGGELGSLASKVLEGTSSDAVAAAAGQVLSGNRSDALYTLAGGFDEDALRSAADDAFGKAAEKAAEKSGGLFSQDYLAGILNSDTLIDSVSQHIDCIVDETPDIAESIVDQVRQDARPSQHVTQESGRPPQGASYVNAPAPTTLPIQPQNVKPESEKRFSLRKFILYACIVVVLLVFLVPNLVSCMERLVGSAAVHTSLSSATNKASNSIVSAEEWLRLPVRLEVTEEETEVA